MKRATHVAFVLAAVTAAALTALPGAALAKDAPSYPEGVSTQKIDDHIFTLVAPKADTRRPWSLLLVIADAGTTGEQFLPLTKEGWVVLMPHHKLSGAMFATSETKDVADDIESVAAAFSIAKDHMHCLAVHDRYGFATFVGFDKSSAFASMSFATNEWSGVTRGKSPPPAAKTRMGVLLMGEGAEPTRFGDPVKIAADFADKFRTVEYRPADDPFKPYFRYWLHVMDGRYEPGRDLSFAWIEDAPPPAPPKPGDKSPPPPVAQNAFDSARATAKAQGSPAFVYFWAAEDATRPNARILQTDVFFDADVRAAAKALVPVKLDRAKYADAFTAFGLKTTPAVVIVDPAFNVIERFEGVVAAKAFAKSLTKAAGGKPR